MIKGAASRLRTVRPYIQLDKVSDLYEKATIMQFSKKNIITCLISTFLISKQYNFLDMCDETGKYFYVFSETFKIMFKKIFFLSS